MAGETVRHARDAVRPSRLTTRRACARAASGLTAKAARARIPRFPCLPEGASPKQRLPLASAVAASGAILLGGLWFGNRRGQQPADSVAYYHYNLGNALSTWGNSRRRSPNSAWRSG